jgi:hypothetical protein
VDNAITPDSTSMHHKQKASKRQKENAELRPKSPGNIIRCEVAA